MVEYTKGEWKFKRSDLTIRSNDFKNGSQMRDYKGVIIADLKPALGCDYLDNVDLEHTGRTHAVPQTLANANLIAASPDTTEALQELIGFLIHDGLDGNPRLIPIINRGTKALKKAGVEI